MKSKLFFTLILFGELLSAQSFTEVPGTFFEGVAASSIAFSDVDGDTDQDLLITGENISSDHISKLYKNNSIVASLENVPEVSPFEFTLFPNPSNTGKSNVSYNAEKSGVLTINIMDLNGNLLRQQRELLVIGQQIFGIDITPWNKGVYIIQLDDGKKTAVHKIIVQ